MEEGREARKWREVVRQGGRGDGEEKEEGREVRVRGRNHDK